MAHQEAGPAGGPSYFGMEVSERDWAGVRAPGPRERFTEKVMAHQEAGPAGGPSYFGRQSRRPVTRTPITRAASTAERAMSVGRQRRAMKGSVRIISPATWPRIPAPT